MKKKIRVLHIITRLINGGADENTLSTISGMDEERFHVELAVGAESEEHLLRILPKKNFILINELKRNIHPVNDILSLFRLFRIIRKNGYDIVHTHTAKAGVIGRLAALFAGTPIIIHTLHGITFHQNLNRLSRYSYIILEKIVGRFTSRFITVGEDLRKKYIYHGIGTPEKYTTIYSGFELNSFVADGNIDDEEIKRERNRLGISNDDTILGTVSRLEPRKGHVYLFDALKQILNANKKIKLLVAGNGDYENELRKYVRQNQLSDHVIFLGFRRDVPRIMRIMDIFTLTSLWEGLPRVLVQAALMQLPVVTFDVEGAWEVVKENENGFIVPVADVDQLAERLKFLIDNPDLAKVMGKRGRDFVSSKWDTSEMVNKITQLYESTISSINGKPPANPAKSVIDDISSIDS